MHGCAKLFCFYHQAIQLCIYFYRKISFAALMKYCIVFIRPTKIAPHSFLKYLIATNFLPRSFCLSLYLPLEAQLPTFNFFYLTQNIFSLDFPYHLKPEEIWD